MARVRKVSLLVLLVSFLLGAVCFSTHAMTISFDESTGIVHEPFFFMVMFGYVFSG